MTLGKLPPRVSRRAILRNGLRISFTPSSPATIQVVLIGVRKGKKAAPPLVLAYRNLGSRSGRTPIRLRIRRKALALVAPGPKITLTVVAARAPQSAWSAARCG